MGWGGYLPSAGVDLTDFVPTGSDDQLRQRFCLDCECSQRGIASDPCWLCGGATTLDRPKYWPTCCGVEVRAGDIFSITELAEAEREVA